MYTFENFKLSGTRTTIVAYVAVKLLIICSIYFKSDKTKQKNVTNRAFEAFCSEYF
jgi:hypothetical protein